jgi:hypothetical protein
MRTQFFVSALRAAAMTAVLLPVASGPAAGQGPKPKQVAGCAYQEPEFNRCALARAQTFKPPRTPDGTPDFQGLGEAPGGAYSFEGPRGPEASSIVDPADGKIPYLPWARPHSEENVAHYIDPYTICQPPGVPRQLALFRTHQITQLPGYLTIVNEAGGHVYRVVYMDGRPHLGSNFKLWMGDSRGRWEGSTLVIETTNFNGRFWLDQYGHFASESLRVVERLTMVDRDTIHYSATVEDPRVFAKPWTLVFALERNKEEGFEQMEEACHESDHDGEFLRVAGSKPYLGPRFPR